MRDVSKREKEANIVPDPDIDTYMKAISVQGQKTSLQTDYILKILGLDVCADTPFGDAMTRGVSSGQKKRLTIAVELVSNPSIIFMDEPTTGLDARAAIKIVSFLQQLAHITDATIVVSLLQPAPETFDLFDDLILIGEGKIIYHGPRSDVLDFFSGYGFRCPQRKGVADFLQEAIDMLAKKYKESVQGKKLSEELSVPFDNQLKKKKKKKNNAISFKAYNSLP
ncbi:hypothetical protein ACS0TY_005518 [Phlomoides rotata]